MEKTSGSEIWGITSFFNPLGHSNKYENYKRFRQQSKNQGLNLVCVELAFDDRPFEINEDDAEIIVRIKGGDENVLWQKERLLNIALKHLPEECILF